MYTDSQIDTHIEENLEMRIKTTAFMRESFGVQEAILRLRQKIKKEFLLEDKSDKNSIFEHETAEKIFYTMDGKWMWDSHDFRWKPVVSKDQNHLSNDLSKKNSHWDQDNLSLNEVLIGSFIPCKSNNLCWNYSRCKNAVVGKKKRNRDNWCRQCDTIADKTKNTQTYKNVCDHCRVLINTKWSHVVPCPRVNGGCSRQYRKSM